MTPEERTKMERLEKTVMALQSVTDTQFIENIKRRLDIDARFRNLRLNDLFDVDTGGVSNGQVIKYTASTTTWDNANDNIA